MSGYLDDLSPTQAEALERLKTELLDVLSELEGAPSLWVPLPDGRADKPTRSTSCCSSSCALTTLRTTPRASGCASACVARGRAGRRHRDAGPRARRGVCGARRRARRRPRRPPARHLALRHDGRRDRLRRRRALPAVARAAHGARGRRAAVRARRARDALPGARLRGLRGARAGPAHQGRDPPLFAVHGRVH